MRNHPTTEIDQQAQSCSSESLVAAAPPSPAVPRSVRGGLPTVRMATVTERCVGLDLGKDYEYCEVVGDQVVKRSTVIAGAKKHLEALLGPGTPPARVAFEACREGWYLYDLLTSWGHRVFMLDTTRMRSLGIGHHRRKNDWIDAETIAKAVSTGRLPLAHVLSPERRALREEINTRRTLVQTRSEFVTSLRGLVSSWGIRLPKCETNKFVQKVEECRRKGLLSADKYAQLQPTLNILRALNPEIEKLDAKLEKLASGIDIARVLMSCPGVGAVVACSFLSVIDEAGRFRNAHQVESYVGLVPSEDTSGHRKLGSITKAGNAYLRSLLVQAAWSLLRARGAGPLKRWAKALGKRKNTCVAAVALARRLTGILWAMWRDGTYFNPNILSAESSAGLRSQAEQIQKTAKAVEASAKKQPRKAQATVD